MNNRQQREALELLRRVDEAWGRYVDDEIDEIDVGAVVGDIRRFLDRLGGK